MRCITGNIKITETGISIDLTDNDDSDNEAPGDFQGMEN